MTSVLVREKWSLLWIQDKFDFCASSEFCNLLFLFFLFGMFSVWTLFGMFDLCAAGAGLGGATCNPANMK